MGQGRKGENEMKEEAVSNNQTKHEEAGIRNSQNNAVRKDSVLKKRQEQEKSKRKLAPNSQASERGK